MLTLPDAGKLIVDTDINGTNDDAFALHYLLSKRRIPSLVTTCSGNTLASDSLKDVRVLLEAYGGPEVDVQAGPDSPPGWTREVHGYHQRLRRDLQESVYLGELGSCRTRPWTRCVDSPGISYSLESSPVDYLALGPLGNLRDALSSTAISPRQIRHLVFSGGAFAVPGNVGVSAEFNVLADPRAASDVFSAAIERITVVPLDVTSGLTYGLSQYRRITQRRSPFGQYLAATKASVFHESPDFREPIWDLVAAMVLVNPQFVTRSVSGNGQVDTSLGALGKTTLKALDGGNVTVVLEVDVDRVLDEFACAFDGSGKLLCVMN